MSISKVFLLRILLVALVIILALRLSNAITLNISNLALTRVVLRQDVSSADSAERVVRVLGQLLSWRGKLTSIRMDNHPELISKRLERWAQEQHIELLHIQPGKPAQNACIERFNRTYREEVLDAYLFEIYRRFARSPRFGRKPTRCKSLIPC